MNTVLVSASPSQARCLIPDDSMLAGLKALAWTTVVELVKLIAQQRLSSEMPRR
jgi:hypothetical protein